MGCDGFVGQLVRDSWSVARCVTYSAVGVRALEMGMAMGLFGSVLRFGGEADGVEGK